MCSLLEMDPFLSITVQMKIIENVLLWIDGYLDSNLHLFKLVEVQVTNQMFSEAAISK